MACQYYGTIENKIHKIHLKKIKRDKMRKCLFELFQVLS